MITAAVAASCVALALAEGGFEPTAYAAAGLAVWVMAVAGLAIGVFPRAEPPGTAVAAGGCLAGFAAVIALSIAWASDDGAAFEDAVRALAYLGIFVLVVVASRRGDARAWLAGLAIGLVAVGAIALAARFVPGPFGDPDAALRETLPAAAGRLTYPIGYWNALAAAMAAAVILCVWLGAASQGRRGRALATAAIPLVALALWATDSRGGVVAAAVAFVILLAAGPARMRLIGSLAVGLAGAVPLIAFASGREQLFDLPGTPAASSEADWMIVATIAAVALAGVVRHALDDRIAGLAISRRGRTVAIAVAVVAVIAVVVASDPIERWNDFKAPPVATEVDGGVDLLRSGGSGRYQFWESAVDAFASAPVEGVGSGGYGPYFLEHREDLLVATRAHSLLFESLAEVGIVGFALVGGFFGVAAVTGIRRLRGGDRTAELGPTLALLAVGIAAAAVDWVWDLPAVFVVAVVAAALITGPASLPPGPGGGPRALGTARSRRRFAGGVALLLVAWVSICASGLLLLADHALDSSRNASARDDLESAIDSANNAIDLQPWAAEPRTQLALLFEKAGDLPSARAALAEAIERSPDDFQLYLLASRFEAEDGDRIAAQASLERARALNPLDPQVQTESG